MKRVHEIDFNRLCGIAISRLGLSSLEFYELSPVEFHYAIQETNERELWTLRNQYSLFRWMLKHMWNMRGRWMKNVLRKDTDVEEFDWEIKERLKNKKPQDPEELKTDIMSVFKQIVANFKNNKPGKLKKDRK